MEKWFILLFFVYAAGRARSTLSTPAFIFSFPKHLSWIDGSTRATIETTKWNDSRNSHKEPIPSRIGQPHIASSSGSSSQPRPTYIERGVEETRAENPFNFCTILSPILWSRSIDHRAEHRCCCCRSYAEFYLFRRLFGCCCKVLREAKRMEQDCA